MVPSFLKGSRELVGDKRQGSEGRRHNSEGRRYARSSSRRHQRRRTIKLMLLITGVSLIVALIISFTLVNLPSFIERTVSKQIEGEMERTVGKGMDVTDKEELKKKLKKYLKE